jgi:hypothetical protein
VVASTTVPATDSSVVRLYLLGLVVDQRAGLLTLTVTMVDSVWPPGTLTVLVPCPAGRPCGSVIVTVTVTPAHPLP